MFIYGLSIFLTRTDLIKDTDILPKTIPQSLCDSSLYTREPWLVLTRSISNKLKFGYGL